MTHKICKKCNLMKPIDEFYKDRGSYESQCKKCKSAEYKGRYADNPKLFLTRNKRWAENNPDRIRNIVKRWADTHPDQRRESLKKYKDKYPERHLEAVLKWQANNPEKLKDAIKKNNAKRISTPKGKLNNALTCGIRSSLEKGTKGYRHWEDLVDYTVEQLKWHLEKQFKPGMTWENYGKAWHIDHKIPIAVFNFERPEDIDFRLCWSLKNLQPLEVKENLKKHAKIDKPFQPALLMEAV